MKKNKIRKIIDFKKTAKDIFLSKNQKTSKIDSSKKDYSKVVVRKPWGYEYLTYQSKEVAVWILHLKKGHQTSMHCHPKKKTSLIVLDGSVNCCSLNTKTKRVSGESIMIEKNVFHQTFNNSKKDAILMEIETPNNKNDLLRLKDKYGREKMGYEKIDQHSVNVNNYNYITLESQNVYFNKTKRYGKSSISFVEIYDIKKLKDIFNKNKSSLFTLLKGEIETNFKKYKVGDTFSYDNYNIKKFKYCLILITKINDQKIRGSDLILNIFDNNNIDSFFCVPGDANLHLMDAIGRKEHLKYYVFNSENSAAFAACSAAKINNKNSVLIISSGYSSSRVIESVSSAYIDSEPLIVISGQARTEQKVTNDLRQFGNKSLNAVQIVKSITKYAFKIEKEEDIAFHLEKALFISRNGRPGPVWIDVPINLLGKLINENNLKHFSPSDYNFENKFRKLNRKISKIFDLINKSQKPVILLGYGIRLSKAEKNILKLISYLNIPVLTSRRGSDLIENNHPMFFGRPGVYGHRYSNFIIQNCDLLLSFGSRLSIPLTGRNTESFCSKAKKIIIEIDEKEINKNNFNIALPINDSVDEVINLMLLNKKRIKKFPKWINRCKKIKKEFHFYREGYKHTKNINPYLFVKHLSSLLPKESIIVMDGGVVMNYVMQSLDIKKGQRLITASGLDNEGFSFPASIGISLSNNFSKIICLCEERTFLNSIFELNILKKYSLNIKIICFSGISYSALIGTQKDFFGGRLVGTESGLKIQNFNLKNMINSFKVKYSEIKTINSINKNLKHVINSKESAFCRVIVDPNQQILPKMGFSLNDNGKWIAKPLEDMYPFLPRDVINRVMK